MLKFQTANVIETFDIIENKWTKHKDLPLVKRRYGVGIIDNKLLIVGGCIEDGKKLSTVFFKYIIYKLVYTK